MYCSSCGRLMYAGARFCDGCGAPAAHLQAQAAAYHQGPGYVRPKPAGIQTASGFREFAGYGHRIGAYFIDYIAALLGSIAVMMTLAVAMAAGGVESERMAVPAMMAIFVAAYLGYYLWGCMCGRTLGKRLVGIRVVALETGAAPGAGPGLVRFVVWLLLGLASLILVPVALVDHLFPLWDDRRQTLHDKAGKTVVVRDAPQAMPVQTGYPAAPGGVHTPAYAPVQHDGWNQPRR